MRLITEVCSELSYLTEEKNGKKLLYVEGPYISVNVPNRNNRIYSRTLMEPVIETFLKDKVDNKTAYGEFGHPSSPKVNEERISHRITSLKWDGNNVVGRAVVLDEGHGKLMRSIIESGGRLGMSTRGLGSVKANDQGLQEVQNDFKLVTVDAVTEPSGVGCFVQGIMEGKDWVLDSLKGIWMESEIEQKIEETKKEINEIKSLDEQLLLMQRFFQQLDEAMYHPKFSGWNNQSANDGKKYKVIRFHKNDGKKVTVAKGLSLSQAQSHCQNPETSSSTAKARAGKRYTAIHGEWFDGYDVDKK